MSEPIPYRQDCPTCENGGKVAHLPEAGYAACIECGERGWWREDGTEWWRNDPESQWYVDDE